MTDKRRFGVIEVRFRSVGGIAFYDLTIAGELWACVEWSPSRRGWCIQDASGRCLAHLDAIHGQDPDAQAAIRIAKRMILDGRLPDPATAHAMLLERERQEHEQHGDANEVPADQQGEPADQLGEPWDLLPDPVLIRRK
jgi:hypothetical protein